MDRLWTCGAVGESMSDGYLSIVKIIPALEQEIIVFFSANNPRLNELTVYGNTIRDLACNLGVQLGSSRMWSADSGCKDN